MADALLYDPLVKMKVTSQGEEVVNLLWDIIAAKGGGGMPGGMPPGGGGMGGGMGDFD